jgi:SAM-dependent methyltransferase
MSDGREAFVEDVDYFARAYAERKDRWWHRFADAPLDLLAASGAKPGERLLDVGCGLGYLVEKAGARGYRAQGVDGSSAAVQFGRERLGLDLECRRVESLEMAKAGQDIVVLNHVLEHVPDPERVLDNVRRWLRPGGRLLIGLPNFASPIATQSGGRWTGLVPSQHLWHFTPGALARMVRRTGFVDLYWRTCMLTYRPVGLKGWGLWGIRWALEHVRLADNLLLTARTRQESA